MNTSDLGASLIGAPTWVAAVVAGLILLSLTLGTTILIGRVSFRLSFARAARMLTPLALILPVVAILLFIGFRSAAHLRPAPEVPAPLPQPELGAPAEIPGAASLTQPESPAASTAQVATPSLLLLTNAAHTVHVQRSSDPQPATVSPTTGTTPVVQLATSSSPPGLPAWVGQPPLNTGTAAFIAVSSQRFASQEEAHAQVARQAVQWLQRYFHEHYGYHGDWSLPLEIVRDHALHDSALEIIDKDFGNGITAPMYRAHVQLELSPGTRDAMFNVWRDQILQRRSMILGAILGLITLILGTSAAYFRLDDWSAGQFRVRLRIAALALISAGGLIVSQIIH